MKVFDYNRKFPCPTDRHVIPIYNEYKSFMQETLDVWKKGVISQLMMQRGYADLMDCRIRIEKTANFITPVISLKPVVAMDFEEKVFRYMTFFKDYEILKRTIIAEVFIMINRSDEERSTNWINKDLLKASVNAIKVLVTSFKTGSYDPNLFEVIIQNPTSEDAANAVRQMGVNHVVGGDFENGGLLSCEVDSDLIGSFYKYVRKIML
jgi:hypothetical protein